MKHTYKQAVLTALIISALAGCAGGDDTTSGAAATVAAAEAAAADTSGSAGGKAGLAAADAAGGVQIAGEKADVATWGRVGGENEWITLPANTTVRYGANGVYVQKVVSGTFQATNAFFGRDPLPGVYKQIEQLSLTPSTATASGAWTRVGAEYEWMTVPANTTVRYGANGSYVQKVVSGTFQATNAFFGSDPVPGVVKQVERLESPTTAAAPAPAPAPAPTPVAAPAPVARVIQVGPSRAVTTISRAAQIAVDGDTIEIDAGTYFGDVARWPQNNLTIRGVNGRPVLNANGASSGGKAIFVTTGQNITIENLEFTNSRVGDNNGAGIKAEGQRTIVRNCIFRDNQHDISTIDTVPSAVLEIYDSQFHGFATRPVGVVPHRVYAGHIARLVVQGSFFTRVQEASLLKSRARETHVMYNRFADGPQGGANYDVDIPVGGLAYVMGNLIEQSSVAGTNKHLVTFGSEGIDHQQNELYMVSNTLVNRRPGGCSWLLAPRGGKVTVRNNLLLGTGCDMGTVPAGSAIGDNRTVTDADFVDSANYDFRLRAGSAAVGTFVNPGSVYDMSLSPSREYRHPASTQPLSAVLRSAGAFQAVQ